MREATFGRRGTIPRVSRRQPVAAPEVRAEPEPAALTFESAAVSETGAWELSPEDEFQAWKAERARLRFARVPWRQLALMASLCFGIAGFVLPDSVNDTVSLVCYTLAVASFVAGIAKRKSASMA